MKTWWFRTPIQVLVLLAMVLVPLVNYYGVKREQRDTDAIEASKTLSAVHAVLGDRSRTEAVELSHKVKGSVWTAEIFGFKVSDPLAALESTTTGVMLYWPLILSIAVPVALTALLGRVYCGWICPMNLILEINDRLRRLLARAGYNVRNVRFGAFTKYAVLLVGLVVAFAVGIPILSLMYPPAIISREIFYKVYAGAFGSGILILAAVCLVELVLSRRWWCRYVCPGGAVYAVLGAKSPLTILRDDTTCNLCGDCVPICPYDLHPMSRQLGMDCDQCGQCIDACDPGALAYRFALRGSKG